MIAKLMSTVAIDKVYRNNRKYTLNKESWNNSIVVLQAIFLPFIIGRNERNVRIFSFSNQFCN